MGTPERDDNEDSAEYYDSRIGIELSNLITVGQDVRQSIDAGTSMTYRQFLELARVFESVRSAMQNRDTLGMHSRTGQDRFRHIAYPEQYPAPEKKKTALV